MAYQHQPGERWIRIYGIELFGCPPGLVPHDNESAQELKIIKVYGIGTGTEDTSCLQTEPFYLLVWGTGQPAGCCATAGSLVTRVWTMKGSAITAQLEATTGTAEELLHKYIG